ncbi:MAG: lysylphosphatidylglycerol synthase transmembrane domain-containing protein [Pyrinomonadaceae bacterium]
MRRYLKFTALILLATLVLWWFGRDLDWAGVRAAVGRADGRWITTGVLLVCGSYLVRALRWQALLAPLAPAGLRELFAATTVGFGAVFLVGRTGEVVRPAFLPFREPRVSPAASFVTIGVERLYDMVAVVLIFAVNLIWFRAPAGGDVAAYARVRQAGVVLLTLAAVGVIALVWFRRHTPLLLGWIGQKLEGRPAFVRRLGHLLVGLLEHLAQALSVLVDARSLAVTVGWTALLWTGIAATNWIILRAFGLPFGLGETLFVLGFALVGSLVPTPGGAAGAFHAATAAGLVFLGTAREQAAAVSIVLHLVFFGPAVIFGLYYFLRSDVSLARLKSLAQNSVPPVERGESKPSDRRPPSRRRENLSSL